MWAICEYPLPHLTESTRLLPPLPHKALMLLRACTSILLLSIGLCLTAHAPGAQDSGSRLTRITGNDGKPFAVEVSRRGGAPEVQPFDSPYFLGGDTFTDDPPVCFIVGTTVRPVLGYKRGTAARRGLEIVGSGGAWFLTYVRDGVNEFWRLNGSEAEPVTLNTGKMLSLRARITRGGERTFLYDTDFDGRSSIYEIKGTKAEPVVLTDRANHGGASYAWWTNGRLLVAFYNAGTYDFRWLKDGAFSSCWAQNGIEDYDQQVDRILSLRIGAALYFCVVRNDKSADIWTIDGDTIVRVKHEQAAKIYAWDDGARAAAGSGGLYFVAETKNKQNQLFLAEGVTVTPLTSGNAPLIASFVHGKGGPVLAGNTVVVGADVTTLPQPDLENPVRYELLTGSLLQQGSRLLRFSGGTLEVVEPAGAPKDFGTVRGAWSFTKDSKLHTYLTERPSGDRLEFRLWKLE